MEVQDALFSLVDTLDAAGIDYAVMGGLAVRVYALPRPTQDVDVTVSLGPERSIELLEIVERAGFEVEETYRKGWTDQVARMPLVKVGRDVGEHKIDIDIFLAASNFQESLLQRRRKISLEDRNIWLASPEDLLLLKLVANRRATESMCKTCCSRSAIWKRNIWRIGLSHLELLTGSSKPIKNSRIEHSAPFSLQSKNCDHSKPRSSRTNSTAPTFAVCNTFAPTSR